jgi:hypothetical protein
MTSTAIGGIVLLAVVWGTALGAFIVATSDRGPR